MELIVAAAVLFVASCPLIVWIARTRSVASAGAAAVGGVLLVVSTGVAMRPTGVPETAIDYRPIAVPAEDDTSSSPCQACHPDQYASWSTSYHSTMTQVPSDESVAAPWNQQFTFEADTGDGRREQRQYALARLGEEFWIASDHEHFHGVPGMPDGRRRMVLVTGSHHEQFYWFETGDTRKVAQLPIAYSIRDQRWVPLRSLLLLPPGGPPHDQFGAWNLVCIRCHSTHGKPRLMSAEKGVVASHENSQLDTRVTEFGIACESCHGAGGPHVEAYQSPLARYAAHFGDGPAEAIVNPARLDPKRSVDVCGSCHSNHIFGDGSPEALARFNQEGFLFRPGDDLSKTRFVPRYSDRDHPAFEPVLEANPGFFDARYWPDGMVSTNGREMNGLMESRCYTHGDITCLSCHKLHYDRDDPRSPVEWADDQLDHTKLGNASCLECHGSYATSIEAHTHHPADSSGSECLNCHMPNTVYGLLKQSRSHQIDSPSVANTLLSTRPNACNLCHLDKTLAWTATQLEDWYGMESPELTDLDHLFVSFAALQALRGDAGLRAMGAWHMGWPPALEASGADWQVPILAQLLEDPYTAVRYIAVKSLLARPGFDDLELDHLAGPEARAEAARAVLERWDEQVPAAERSRGEAILIHSDGRPNRSRIERLTRMRDDRPVYREE